MDYPIIPFRWNIKNEAEIHEVVKAMPVSRLELPPNTTTELIRSLSRALAFGGDAHWYFVGRSPESYFDFLSGVFDQKPDFQKRIHLLQFSSGFYRALDIVKEENPDAIPALRRYFEAVGLHPTHIKKRKRKTTFIDIVSAGGTFGALMGIFYDWTKELKEDWDAINDKIRIIGFTIQTHTSPNTWRWQQRRTWVKRLGMKYIKNVSISGILWGYIGNYQAKTVHSFPPGSWDNPRVQYAKYHRKRDLLGLREALFFYRLGKSEEGRKKLRSYMVKEKEVKERWFRDLIGEL